VLRSEDPAVGKWHLILKDNGLTELQLSGKQAPCPTCGGTDRFRFDNKEGRGTWYCNKCGAGDGYKLLGSITGDSFGTLKHRIAKEYAEAKGKTVKAKDPQGPILNRVWGESRPGGQEVSEYLRGRGIDPSQFPGLLNVLHFHPRCRWGKGADGGYAPAMLARVYQNNKPVTIHRTYLTTDVPDRKTLMPHDDKLVGAYIPLVKGVKHIIVGEGIETVLSAAQLHGHSTGITACIAANYMERYEPPQGCEQLDIYGDTDASYTGQAAAYRLAFNTTRKGIPTRVMLPPEFDTDFNDILIAHQRSLACIA
jgi:putative DNA primase/helicase